MMEGLSAVLTSIPSVARAQAQMAFVLSGDGVGACAIVPGETVGWRVVWLAAGEDERPLSELFGRQHEAHVWLDSVLWPWVEARREMMP
jgi:hypothetical protein